LELFLIGTGKTLREVVFANRHPFGKLRKKIINTLMSSDLSGRYLDYLIKKRDFRDENMINTLRYVAIICQNGCSSKKDLYSKILKGLKIEEFSELAVMISQQNGLQIKEAASFRANLSVRSRKNQLGDYGLE